MVEWHKPNITAEQILEALKEGREENDKKFDSYADYADYIYEDNERILKDFGDYMDDKDYEETLNELRRDRDEKDDQLFNMVLETLKDNQHILDALGSDFDENGIPYWEKWEKNGGRKESNDN